MFFVVFDFVLTLCSLLQCFTPTDLLKFDGSPPSKVLNSTEFAEFSPVIVYCLLPAREKDDGQQPCVLHPKNHSELFNSFARNFSHGQQGITEEALEGILEQINQTIGEFLTEKKVDKLVYCSKLYKRTWGGF